MKLINARSPYIIEVNQSGSDGSKIELFLWPSGTTEPPQVWYAFGTFVIGDKVSYNGNYYSATVSAVYGATPPTHTSGTALNWLYIGSSASTGTKVYELSKSNPSLTQTSTQYNVSNFIREYINNSYTVGTNSFAIESPVNNWVNVRIKRYELVGATYNLLDSTVYAGVNGYTEFMDGLNAGANVTTSAFLMGNSGITYKIKDNSTNYLNVFVQAGLWNYINSALSININLNITDFSIIRFPIKTGENRLWNLSIPAYQFSIYGVIEDEAKYTPSVCRFINKKGGWDFVTFYKAKVINISSTETKYKILPSALNYDTSLGQYKVYNTNGQKSIKLNSGWVDENHSILIQDLLLSETVFLDDVPVIVKTQSFEAKTSLQNKQINYEIEFDYAFDLINTVI